MKKEWMKISRYDNRTFSDDEMTGYEKEVKELCNKIRLAKTVEDSMRLYLNYQHYNAKRWKI
jgi:hypothetical protein